MKLLQYIFSVVVVFLAAYGLITKTFVLQYYMVFFLSILMVVMGLQEFQKGRKVYGWLFLGAFFLSLFASTQGFLIDEGK